MTVFRGRKSAGTDPLTEYRSNEHLLDRAVPVSLRKQAGHGASARRETNERKQDGIALLANDSID